MEFTCSRPIYTKEDISGSLIPTYSFELQTSAKIVAILTVSEQKNLQGVLTSALSEEQNHSLVPTIVREFITLSAKYFAKAYTFEQILKYFTNEVCINSVKMGIMASEDAEITLSPTKLLFQKNTFRLIWSATFRAVLITIPDLDETMTATTDNLDIKNQEIRTVQIASHPLEGLETIDDIMADTTQVETFSMRDTSRHYDKQRVKEAQLRARLSQYKAERAMTRYLEKYGDQVSDSEWEDDLDSDDA